MPTFDVPIFDALAPRPPDWSVPWDDINAAYGWVRALKDVPQDPQHHAEGDVATHTRLGLEALATSAGYRNLPDTERSRLFAAVLMHDAAKPFTTQETDGRITAHGHSRGGDLLARRVLWELGADPIEREHVCALIRHHQVPFWALERDDLDAIAFRVSLLARNADLVELARADIRGRICDDAEALLDNVDLYAQWCADRGCLERPRDFATDHARFAWFRHPARDPDYAAYDDTTFSVTVMSGLPATGKDTWIAGHRGGQQVISLDEMRDRMGIAPTADQAPVIAAARDQARTLLRAKEPFIWNGTNITRQMRQRIIGLCADYGARVEIVATEAPRAAISTRNRARPAPVPESVIDRLVRRWEAPDVTEAHQVTLVATLS
jgi:predicted kinase